MKTFAVLVIALTATGSAAATPPTTQRYDVVDRGENEVLSQECGFPVQSIITGTLRITTFYDTAGEPVRQQVWLAGARTALVNAETGKSLDGRAASVEITSYETLTVTFVGLNSNITLPGHGQLALGAGRLVFDMQLGEPVFEVGRTDWPVDIELICDYLAAPAA